MKLPLASWGVLLLGAAAALGRGAANPDGADGNWDDSYVKREDSQAEENSTAGKPAFSRPLLRKKHLMETGKVGRGMESGVSESNHEGTLPRGFFVVADKQAPHDDRQPSPGHPPFKESRNSFQGSARATRKSPDSSSSKGTDTATANASGGSGGSTTTTTPTTHTTTTSSCASPPCEQLPKKVPAGDNSKHDPPYSSSNNCSRSSSSSSSCRVIDTPEEAARTAARNAAIGRALAMKIIADYRVMQRTLHVLDKIRKNQLKKKLAISYVLWESVFDRIPTRRSMVCPRDPWMRKPTCALQVGDTLTDTVRQAEGGPALWPGTGGSQRPRRMNPVTSPTEDGGDERPGSEATRFATLLGSSPDKTLKALDAGKPYLGEESGKDAGTGSTKGTVGGWLPRAQRAKKTPFDKVDASGKPKVAAGVWSIWPRGGKRNDLGDVTVALTISEKVATAGGTTPLSNYGRSGWDWFSPLPSIRPQVDRNKTNVTEAGEEVRRGRRTVWGVNADERVG